MIGPEDNYVGTLPRGGMRMPRAFSPDGLVAYWATDEPDILSVVVRQHLLKLWSWRLDDCAKARQLS